MSDRQTITRPVSNRSVTTTRRQLLAATGVIAVGGLSGCLGQVASATTNVGASPAAPFAGVGEYTGPSPVGEPVVYKLTPTVATDIGDVELEAWVTAKAVAAVGYNNSRSNRATIRDPRDSDSDGDGIDDTVELRSNALELEKQLLSQTKAATSSISKRSARTGRNQLAEMGDTIQNVQATLERCSDDVCVIVRDHADGRLKLTRQAAAYVENGEWDSAAGAVQEVQAIVEGDIDLLESSLEDGATSEPSLSDTRLQELTGASDEDITALYEYLAGEPVISEQFTITVPDARVPGRDLALVDELTPRRVIEYVTGRADEDGKVYAWGSGHEGEKSRGDSSNPLYEGESVGGESAIYRGDLLSNGGDGGGSPLHTSDALSSYVSGPVDTGRHLDVVSAAGNVTVLPVNDPPQAAERSPAITVSADGGAVSPAGFDDWGVLDQPTEATSTLVCPVLVAPPECPSPFPALLYVRRCTHDDQHIYTGGWVIDDGFLYENSTTLVAVDGPTAVIGISAGDLDGDGYGDVMARRLSGDRERRGARLFDGTVSDAVADGVLSESEGDDIILRKRPGRTKSQEKDDDDDDTDQNEHICKATHLSAVIGHFTGSASDNVKFKAGAELSKSVN